MQIPKFAWRLLGVSAGAFAVTFTIYFFNLDMKLLSAFEPHPAQPAPVSAKTAAKPRLRSCLLFAVFVTAPRAPCRA